MTAFSGAWNFRENAIVTESTNVLSYGGRLKRWTTLGVGAISCASVGMILLLAALGVIALRVGVYDLILTFMFLVSVIATMFGTILGAIACISGTADPLNRRDAFLGLISVLLCAGQLFVVIIFLVLR